jgi:hypothetical protein
LFGQRPPQPPEPQYFPEPVSEPPQRLSDYDAYPSSEVVARRVVARRGGSSSVKRVLIVVIPFLVALGILAILWFVSIAR